MPVMQHKIMVVEDNAQVVETLSTLLRDAGFEVFAVEDEMTSIDKARDELPSLIVLDLMLPRISGLDICQALKSEATTRHIPVIMLTAKSDETSTIAGLQLGADDYITKPFNPRELVLRINRALLL